MTQTIALLDSPEATLPFEMSIKSNDILMDEEVVREYYEEVKDLIGFRTWIMNSWFNPEKHSGKVWFNAMVTPEMILGFITENPKFPYTPNQLADMWKTMPHIRRGLTSASADSDIEAVEVTIGTTYKKGEQTLSSIGLELGDVSATMVKKIGDTAEEKVKRFYTELASDSCIEEENALKLLDDARLHAAVEWATLLKNSEGNINAFFGFLVKAQILSIHEVGLLNPNEIDAILMLYQMEQEVIEEILIEDIEEDDNIFKTFQNAVSKRIFPGGKRGRPRLNNVGI